MGGKAAGKVYLVGGGPGDPGLLTVRAQQLLSRADVVVYDFLIDDDLLSCAPRAELIPVGDPHGDERFGQDRVNELLVQLASSGKLVVRLKGGDPYLFGRGGEEGLALRQAGVPFEVIPGVSSALAVPAYAGVPVTHRGYASSVTIFTGQEQGGKLPDSLNSREPAVLNGTRVFLMAATNLQAIVDRLIGQGAAAGTPAAAIQWGTRPQQRTVVGGLADLPGLVEQAGLQAPMVVVVGEVVNLRDALSWYERLPLFGLGVLVTRTRQQSSGFAESLRELGALVFQLPVIEVEPLAGDEVDGAIRRLAAGPSAGGDGYDWVVFTSANGVRCFCDRLWAGGFDARAFGSVRICAIGPETAAALRPYGLQADQVPPAFVAEAVVDALLPFAPRRVLLPRAAEAREVLPEHLRQSGATVDVVPVYATKLPIEGAERLRSLLNSGQVNVVTFTSSSTVANFMKMAGSLPAQVKVACIGPVTSRTAEEHGLRVDVVAGTYTTAGLREALVERLGRAV